MITHKKAYTYEETFDDLAQSVDLAQAFIRHPEIFDKEIILDMLDTSLSMTEEATPKPEKE